MEDKILLWLDDCRDPHTEEGRDYVRLYNANTDGHLVVWVRDWLSYATYMLWAFRGNQPMPDIISFDYDLEDEDEPMPQINFHTANPEGREEMEQILEEFKLKKMNDTYKSVRMSYSEELERTKIELIQDRLKEKGIIIDIINEIDRSKELLMCAISSGVESYFLTRKGMPNELLIEFFYNDNITYDMNYKFKCDINYR